MTPTATEVLEPTKTLFDLDTMTDITLLKQVNFVPVTTTQEALERLGHDAKKFLEVINEGLVSHAKETAKADPSIPWMLKDDEGNLIAWSGTPADSKAVNGLVLNLAKSVFGYAKESSPEVKRAAKESAMEMIKNNDAIREGLKKNAAA